jgi:hypothetical protein
MDIILNPISILLRLDFTHLVICSLITDSFAHNIVIPVELILKIISKMCSFNTKDLIQNNNQSIDSKAIAFIIPEIHSFAFNILEALLLRSLLFNL